MNAEYHNLKSQLSEQERRIMKLEREKGQLMDKIARLKAAVGEAKIIADSFPQWASKLDQPDTMAQKARDMVRWSNEFGRLLHD